MDFYVEDIEGKIFNVEMQKRNEGNIPKRTRFYQGLIDAPLLKSGEPSFDNLNAAYIIVICGFDLFGYDRYRYTFKNLCEEVPGLELGDECTKVILNTKGKNVDETDQKLRDFLHYIAQSSDENVPEDCDERLKRLHEKIKKIKASAEIGVAYMKMEERDRLIKRSGIEEGIKALTETLQEMDIPKEQVCLKLREKFELSADEAEAYMKEYWK